MNREDVLVIKLTYRPSDPRCAACFSQLAMAGYKTMESFGCADITHSINLALTQAVELSEFYSTVVFVDDDMVYSVDNVDRLVGYARKSPEPVSGVAVDHDGKVPFQKMNNGLSATGTAFLAMRTSLLRAVWGASKKLEVDGRVAAEFTWSKDGVSPDFRLCQRLGGVRVVPIRVGHVKPVVLMPTIKQMEEALTITKPEGP